MSQQEASASKGLSAAAIGEKALVFMAKCKLPPTPEVFEVWYRYFEGLNDGLRESLENLVADPSRIDIELVKSIHSQYCGDSRAGVDEQLTSSLLDELGGFRSIIDQQRDAGSVYAEQLEVASGSLKDDPVAEVSATVDRLVFETKRMQSKVEQMQRQVVEAEQRAKELEDQLQVSQAAMMTDHLTGLGNRRMYDSLIRTTVRSTERDENEQVPYLALIDCDKFKEVNDTFGHAFGDLVIRRVADAIQSSLPNACIARMGGDEFAAVFRCATPVDAEQSADKIRESFSRQKIVHRESGETLKRVTLSIGVARIRPQDDEATWPERADKLLYEAKKLGGDRSVVEQTR